MNKINASNAQGLFIFMDALAFLNLTLITDRGSREYAVHWHICRPAQNYLFHTAITTASQTWSSSYTQAEHPMFVL
jgi:hypothetical protein